MRHSFLTMTDEQRAAMLDAMANPIPNPDRPRPMYRAVAPGTCNCSCALCNKGKHCRHILLCGLGYPDEIELTDADLEEV